jgi:tetratricopeptide (TPR) repeat protein
LNEWLKEAARLYAARDYRAAEAVCRAIIHGDPQRFDALHLLGVLLTLQDQPEAALPYLRRAEAEGPGHALLRVNLGNVLVATKRYREAVAVSQGGDATALNNLGLAYRGLEQHEDAAQAFRRATEARWDYAPAWSIRRCIGWPTLPMRLAGRCWASAGRRRHWRRAVVSSNAIPARRASSGT